MSGDATVVAVRGLRVGYGSIVVLADIELTVTAGQIVAVTGVNGVGKSTLLSCLAGLRRPAAGTVSVLGEAPRDDPAFWRAITFVADQPTWYPGLTVREHLELIRLTHEPVRGWCLPADELIEVFGLSARADASPLDMSSGLLAGAIVAGLHGTATILSPATCPRKAWSLSRRDHRCGSRPGPRGTG